MPKTATHYSKNVIYKIQHNDDDSLLYVGHTTNFIKRKNNHKSDCNISKKTLYKMIRDNGGWECYTMIVIKEYPCETKTEACIEEDRIMREMKATLNKLRAYLSLEEKSEQRKEYREKNKEYISARQNDKIECECGCIFTNSNLARHKKSKNHLNNLNQDYREEKNKEKVKCECGCVLTKLKLTRHKKTQKHFKNLK